MSRCLARLLRNDVPRFLHGPGEASPYKILRAVGKHLPYGGNVARANLR